MRALALCILATTASAARAAEIIFADGRRETVQEPRKDSQGRWTAVRDGHRTSLRPGDVVVVIDDAGSESVTIPSQAEPPDAPESAAALASLRDPKNDAWRASAERLGTRPTKALLDALVALTSDANKELRSRAIVGLTMLRTKEGVTAAAAAVLAEKDATLRREAASALFAVGEIFVRSESKDLVQAGISDRDAMVRIVFASLAPLDLEAAKAVLRTDGLKHGDHHVRESAAVQLGRRGDGAGESILVGMLARARLPGIDDDALMERMMTREKVEVCALLGKLGTDTAKAALRKAAASGVEAVRKAAEAALAAADAK